MNKPTCNLTNGNVYALAAQVRRTLRRAGQEDKEREFSDRLPKCQSYGEALSLMKEYVEAT